MEPFSKQTLQEEDLEMKQIENINLINQNNKNNQESYKDMDQNQTENQQYLNQVQNQPEQVKQTFTSRTATIMKFLLILIYFTIVITGFFLITFYPPFKELIYRWMKQIESMGSAGYLLLIIAGITNALIGMPIVLYELFLGFTMKSFLSAYIIDSIQNIISPTIQFFLVKYCFKEKALNYFKNKKSFKLFKLMIENSQVQTDINANRINQQISEENSQSEQQTLNQNQIKSDNSQSLQQQKNPRKSIFQQGNWKNLFLIQLLYVPLFIKNYSIPLFKVSYVVFLLTQLPITIGMGGCQIYIGYSAKNFQVLMNGNDKLGRLLFIVTIIASLTIMIYLICYSKRKMREMGQGSSILELSTGEDEVEHGIINMEMTNENFQNRSYDNSQNENNTSESLNNEKSNQVFNI